MYNPPRPPEVYTLTDAVNETLPLEIRQTFQHDSNGRVLFFTVPPLNRNHKGVSPDSAHLGHSVKYLAGRKEWLAERDRKRKERDESVNKSPKRAAIELAASKEKAAEILAQAVSAVDHWFQQFDEDTEQWKAHTGLEGWTRQHI